MTAAVPSTLRLDLDQLVSDYVHNLNVTLRGFQAVAGCDFLATFVPSEDPTTCVRDLVELAYDAGVRTLVITTRVATAAGIDQDRLRKEIGECEATPAADRVEFIFSKAPGAAAGGIHPVYRRKLEEMLAEVGHEGTATVSSGRVVEVEENGTRIWVDVDPETHVVLHAGFHTVADPVTRGLLETFCRVIENVPLIEAADHAAIRVEAFLRDIAAPPPVMGTILPQNAAAPIVAIQRLVRDLLVRYRAEADYGDLSNTYDCPVSVQWLRLPEGRRIDAAKAVIRDLPGGDALEITRIEGLRRVVGRFSENCTDPAIQQQLLVRAETLLRKGLDTPLQLVLEVQADKNVIRQVEPRK